MVFDRCFDTCLWQASCCTKFCCCKAILEKWKGSCQSVVYPMWFNLEGQIKDRSKSSSILFHLAVSGGLTAGAGPMALFAMAYQDVL